MAISRRVCRLQPHGATLDQTGERSLCPSQILRGAPVRPGGQADAGQADQAAIVQLQEVAGQHAGDGHCPIFTLAMGSWSDEQQREEQRDQAQW